MAVISATALSRLYLARERLREGVELQSDPTPLARMRGVLALDDAVELVVITLLSLRGIKPKEDAPLAKLLEDLVGRHPALGSHSGPLQRLRRVRNLVKHLGVVPSPEDLRLSAVEAESFARAAVPAVTGLTLEQTSPLAAIEEEDLRTRRVTARAKFEEGDYLTGCVEASLAFALGCRRFEFKRRGENRDAVERAADDFIDLLRGAAESGSWNSTDRDRGFSSFCSALERSRYKVRDIFDELALPTRLARMGIDLAELERFEGVTPRVTAQDRGEWGEVVTARELTPTRDDASFALDFATRSLLGLQDRLARMGNPSGQ